LLGTNAVCPKSQGLGPLSGQSHFNHKMHAGLPLREP
jgi:hypothetical protein